LAFIDLRAFAASVKTISAVRVDFNICDFCSASGAYQQLIKREHE